MTKFSIIIPCYNAQATILDTLASLQAQTITSWEAVCIDDGSSDDTCALIRQEAAKDDRIKLVRNTGKGPSTARNMGAFEASCGELIAFCDADDQWLPTKLSELSDVFADPTVEGAFGQIAFFQDTPEDAHVFSTVPEHDLSIDMLLGENPVCTMSNITVRRHTFVKSDGFDVRMVHNEDLEWLIRLVGQGARIVGISSLQTWYRTSVGGLSTDLEAMEAGRNTAIKTAAEFGVTPSAQSDAIHHRYLARRALRVGKGRTEALRLAVTGFAQSPSGFMTPFRRGALTLAGAGAATVLPRTFSRSLFS